MPVAEGRHWHGISDITEAVRDVLRRCPDGISAEVIQIRVGLSYSTILDHLNELRSAGEVVHVGRGVLSTWRLTDGN
jgi:DNA-binding CsgD family transcriptional regulator